MMLPMRLAAMTRRAGMAGAVCPAIDPASGPATLRDATLIPRSPSGAPKPARRAAAATPKGLRVALSRVGQGEAAVQGPAGQPRLENGPQEATRFGTSRPATDRRLGCSLTLRRSHVDRVVIGRAS